METESVIFVRAKGVARIVINRPKKMNALSVAVRKRLLEVLEAVKDDETIRILIITGAGEESFIAGGDLNELKDYDGIQILKYLDSYSQNLYSSFERLPIPTIALINGHCFGGGCELALACDIRIATPNARFGLPELRLGVIPAGGGTQRLVKYVGLGRAKEIILSGRILQAKEAETIGLVNKVVSKDKIEKYVEELAIKIMSQGPIAVRMAKLALNASTQGSLDMGMRIEALSEAVCYSTEDKKEGLYAFMERRRPHFKNK